MLSLDVADYCQECPKFEPECTKFYYGDRNCTTLISCENNGMCANIKLYIEKRWPERMTSNGYSYYKS